ncbi:FtsX-like permease family protein [Paenibacillus sp. LHD-117]|uniref:ABC transporter permease n=1 Tax=Paenibacillus sp. LHD-117 TaxID=3071412 RepID=UPI0027E1FB9F|nr:FtsX-like permease family protein [Paenibacillus sp. LHD-117]MDQ6421221.1 FtsX-like permease family protein [Paenibacillus sp. LHD-117]
MRIAERHASRIRIAGHLGDLLMALFVMIIRKMVQNKWLLASLFMGILISVALVSSMPIYSEAVLSRMLTKDLENLQTATNQYPGTHYSNVIVSKETPEQINAKYDRVDGYIRGTGAQSFGLPVQELVASLQSMSLKMKQADDPEPISDKNQKWVTIKSYGGLEDHITIKDGRMPAMEPVDGVYEVLVTERGLSHYKMVLDTVFVIEDKKVASSVKLKPVGIFEKKTDDDPYFRYGDLSDMNGSFILPFGIAERTLLREQQLPLSTAGWYVVMDYTKMELRTVEPFVSAHERMKETLQKSFALHQMGSETRALDTISVYMERAEQLRTLMWALNVPILLMLAFYMFMVSNLIAGRQRNEIAVLRSRGAARWQVIAAYLTEGLLLCGAAFALGPLLGAVLTEVLGASNGFLAFVQRVSLPVRVTEESYRFALIAACACLVIVIIPIVLATRVSIVSHKQQSARLTGSPLWHKMFLDVITLGLAIYGLITFRKRQADLQALGLNAKDLAIDPLQFIVPALFIMGAGLLLLRLYPWILKFVYWIGKKWWPPSLYATLIQVGRSSSQYQFLMIFLIMTIATGVFSASAARTINANTEDRIRYGNGADMVLGVNWVNDAPPPAPPGGGPAPPPTDPVPDQIHYLEPAFEPFSKLPGVEHAAKVFTKKDAGFYVNEVSGTATLIGIDTDQFGLTSWFRDALMDYPLHDYLNLIAPDTSSVLISRTLAEQKGVQPGDMIWIGWQEVTQQPFKVYGIIDYFPTFNPNPPLGSVNVSEKEADNAPMLIVGHLPRIQVQLALEPYDVWLKLKEGASTAEVYEGIEEGDLSVSRIVNTREDLVRAKNDPFLLALNGVLTLGFVLAILVSFIGFLLYWILSLRGRTLQNGILRAIGLSVKNLIAMLAAEQLLTSGVAVLLGIVVGNVASLLYVPNFQIAFNPSSLVPPFIVKFEAMDFIRIYVTVGFMLLVGLGILAYMLSRLRIHQALKLGED